MNQREQEEQNELELGIARIEIKELRQSLTEEKEKAEKIEKQIQKEKKRRK